MEIKPFMTSENIYPLVKGTGPIVLIDDDPHLHVLARKCYQKSQKTNDFITFSKAEDFLNFMDEVASGKYPIPELVLIDINMPKTNGFDILVKVKEESQFSEKLNVIMLSATETMEDKEKSYRMKASGLFQKPLHVEELVHFFNNI